MLAVLRRTDAALFGNLLAVTETDLLVIAAVFTFTIIVVFFSYKQLLFLTFDPDVAPVYGVRAGWPILCSPSSCGPIIASIRIMGVTLIAASLVIPPVIARLVTDRFAYMLFVSTGLGALLGFFGLFMSYEFDIASGASIVLLSAAAFAAVLAVVLIREWTRTGRLSIGNRSIGSAEREAMLD
ncbi:MAG: metal ABC transporter permease [Dehalococcoidia bacterium]